MKSYVNHSNISLFHCLFFHGIIKLAGILAFSSIASFCASEFGVAGSFWQSIFYSLIFTLSFSILLNVDWTLDETRIHDNWQFRAQFWVSELYWRCHQGCWWFQLGHISGLFLPPAGLDVSFHEHFPGFGGWPEQCHWAAMSRKTEDATPTTPGTFLRSCHVPPLALGHGCTEKETDAVQYITVNDLNGSFAIFPSISTWLYSCEV